MYEAFQSESDPGDHGWQDDANCLGVDPDLFFPERGASTREAKEVCRGCVVREECLEFALQNGETIGRLTADNQALRAPQAPREVHRMSENPEPTTDSSASWWRAWLRR